MPYWGSASKSACCRGAVHVLEQVARELFMKGIAYKISAMIKIGNISTNFRNNLDLVFSARNECSAVVEAFKLFRGGEQVKTY